MIEITARFEDGFHGELETAQGTLPIGMEEGSFNPYNLLLGALSACYYATLLGIARKMELDYERCEISVQGVKRETSPTTLKYVRLDVRFFGAVAEDQKKYERAASLAAKYCSIYQTISQVSEMEVVTELA